MLPLLSKKTSEAGVWESGSTTCCSICKGPFTFFFRQHHCRCCGKVVCTTCSPARRRLKSSRTGRKKRVCVQCVAAGAPDREDSVESAGGGGGDGGGGGGGCGPPAAPVVIDLVAGTGRATAADQARGGELPITAAAAIESGRDKRGLYNWALFETSPEPPLLLVNAGTLSVAEVRLQTAPSHSRPRANERNELSLAHTGGYLSLARVSLIPARTPSPLPTPFFSLCSAVATCCPTRPTAASCVLRLVRGVSGA